MQCFDCALEARISPAVAVCSTCGAGLCTDHAVSGHADEPMATVGNPTTHRLPGRRVVCHTCAADGAFDAAPVPHGRVTASVG